MDSQLQSISKIFTEKLFRIPDYQRGYAWTEKQLKDFWGDVMQLESDRDHYVGVLTLEPVDSTVYNNWKEDRWIIESKSFEPFYVVDGQQRLTTIIILIQTLTELIGENAELNYSSAKEIKKRYIFDSKDNGVSRSYIFGYEKDNPSDEFLKMFIFNEKSTSGYGKEVTIYTHNLLFAKEFFLEKIKTLTLKQKELVFRKVTQNFLFNIYSITKDIDVFVSFETMNNRGKALSNLELLKNRLIFLSTKFKVEDTEKSHLRKVINDGWKGIYHYLGKNKEIPLNDDEFLQSHLLVYLGNEVFSKEDDIEILLKRRFGFPRDFLNTFLFEQKFSYKNLIDNNGKLSPKTIKDYVESLQESVIIWYNLHNPTKCEGYSDEEKLLLDKIWRLGLPRFSSLLLALYLKKPKLDLRIQFLKTIERYAFINILFDGRIYRNNINFSAIGMMILKGKVTIKTFLTQLNTEIEALINQKDSIDRLSEIYKYDGFYSWTGIRYFLYEYEISLRDASKTKKNKINWEEYSREKDDFISIEHIYPQTVKDGAWKNDYGMYNLKQRRILNNSLGNLLPLSRPKNSSLQNKQFLSKVDNSEGTVGYRYGSYSENEISGLNAWTPEDILKRGLKLLNFLSDRWGVDLQSEERKIEILGLSFMRPKI